MSRHLNRLAMCGALVVSLVASGAAAFKESGHRAIEVEAYRELLRRPNGAQALQVLLDHGVLKAPGYPAPLPNAVTDPGYEHYRVEALVALTHMPDHLMDRQLHAERQCFHFNARGAHTTLSDATLAGFPNVPRGLVVDAYVECIGVTDGILRGILYDPVAAHDHHTDIYSLMHMIEDSYSDAHVARSGPVRPLSDASPPTQNQILFIKPWNLRTWSRYFLGGMREEPVYQHFSSSHHTGSDSRDLGYLVGPTDEDYPRTETEKEQYQKQRVAPCLRDARPLIRPASVAERTRPLRIEELYGEVVPPLSCLSNRALAAKQAVVELLELIATYLPHVAAPVAVAPTLATPEIRTVGQPPGALPFEKAWLRYRRKFLGHRLDSLTVAMAMRNAPDRQSPASPVPSSREADKMAAISLRNGRVAPAKRLAPKEFKEAGFGLGVEVRGSTPLWLGIDEFVSRRSANHNRTIVLFDVLGWGLQARLPIENDLGEHPVGAAFDLGPAIPLPFSELIHFDEVQLYLGARARIAYTAQAIFEGETRHSVEFGFGGIAADLVIGGQAWIGIDAFRKLYLVDFWDPTQSRWSPLIFGVTGGVAIDAL